MSIELHVDTGDNISLTADDGTSVSLTADTYISGGGSSAPTKQQIIDALGYTPTSVATVEEVIEEDVPLSDITANTSARHTHTNKTVLDGITSAKVSSWDNKSTFSGNYNDLTNKPTIPEAVTDDHINSLIDTKLGVIENGSY